MNASTPKNLETRNWGHAQSQKALGSEVAFEPAHNILHSELVKETGGNQQAISNRIHSLENEQIRLKSEIEGKASQKKHILQTLIPNLKGQIGKFRGLIDTITLEGVKHPVDYKKVAGIGVIMLGLTGYLFLFYSSAIYTALYGSEDLFNNLNKGKLIISAIFNTEALTRAYYKGISSLAFTVFFTFVFLCLGVLIHFYKETRKYLLLASVVLLTFTLDMALAYMIAKNIHEVRHLARLEPDVWQAGMASTDINFYFVLIAGFGVYVIWGLLLSLLSDEVAKGGASQAERVKQERIRQLEQRIEGLENDIAHQEEALVRIEGDVVKLEGEIAVARQQAEQLKRGVIVIDKHEMSAKVNDFLQGWTEFLFDHYAQQKAKSIAGNINQISTDWMVRMGYQYN